MSGKHKPHKQEINKQCPRCGKDFITSYSRQIYCSRQCSSTVNKERARKKVENEGPVGYARIRWLVLLRDGFMCQYCGRTPYLHSVELHVDHIHPISEGGSDKEDNLITSCTDCNLGKGNSDYGGIKEYFGEKDFRLNHK